MVRPILTELLLFLTPFAVYALFLWATRAGVLHPESWPRKTVAVLTVLALALSAAGFFFFGLYSGAPPGSTYEPAHMEDGRFVPGRTR
jgi:hypothetical protein